MKMHTIPAGIEWRRINRLHSLCIIRRVPETVIEWEAEDWRMLSQADADWARATNYAANWAPTNQEPSRTSGVFLGLFGGLGL